MINYKFETYKIAREIKHSGSTFVVKRRKKNSFGELTKESCIIGTFSGIFHTEQDYVETYTADATVRRNLGHPMITTLYDSVLPLKLQQEDIVQFLDGCKKCGCCNCNKKVLYEVVEINDVQNWKRIVNLTLKEIDDGSA